MAYQAPPIEDILAIVRTASAADAVERLLALGQSRFGTDLWERLRQVAVDWTADVTAARRWLESELRDPDTTGIYLGLDTLNMEKQGEEYAPPQNVEIGLNNQVDPARLEMDWAWECDRYGSSHLIIGLRDLARAYAGEAGDLFGGAEYILFLGYSGVVLKEALAAVELPERQKPLLAVWGFHDGDLYYLGRRHREQFEVIAGS